MPRSSRAMSLLSPPSSQHHQPPAPNDALLPDLKGFLDAEPRPTFLVAINPQAPTPFELLLCNHAFYMAGLGEGVLAKTRAATLFRSWCQVASHWRSEIDFAGRIWTAFKIQDRWKCIRASDASSVSELRPRADLAIATDDVIRRLEDVKFADARLAGLYQMMEMSDVGTFEYSPEGMLLRANESWYRLSQHPKQKTAHANFSFMDLVYPPDAPMVLSQWNKLTQGSPVTFEMRWKGRNYGRGTSDGNTDECQWILSTCVPIMDKDGNLVSIAGNTIDINAQKRVQEEALQRAEALERARQSERKFARFALLAPIAIVILDTQRRMTYCNMRFFELTGLPPVDEYKKIDWQSICYPGDQNIVGQQWHKVLRDKQRTQAHFRLNRTWNFGDGAPRQAWAECQTIPELNDEGNVVSIFSVMTDISRFKWAEEVQRTRIEEALEAKRKHENFIDMTSHEMRNPLSAVIQCADSTIDSLRSVQSQFAVSTVADDEFTKKADDEIKLCLDSLQTIISCSLHQKRVVDDILTLSKMDSNLMAITPVRVEPASVVAEAVHMFEVECNKDNIDLSLTEDPSLRELGAQYVMMDPSRTLQVLINLVTNAIKFTRDRPVRRIEISLGASLTRPTQDDQDISYANVTTSAGDLLDNEEWGAGREVYIWIKCRDTGCGLSLEEQGSLFTRFSQATPRTHIRYGGSGLGLFISKKLTELQGGAIGVQSQPDVGSTFAFFVATRTSPPPTPMKVTSIKDDPWNWPVTMEDNGQDHNKYSVLIVEDNLVNQKVLSQQLQKAGCTVYVSNHGAEALDFLRTTEYWASPPSRWTTSSPPADGKHDRSSSNSSNTHSSNTHNNTTSTDTDTSNTNNSTTTRPSLATVRTGAAPAARTHLSVILMDIEMPVMDGLACARQIRALQATGDIVGHVPIMAVSANARSEQVAQARDAGMDDAIAKPFRIPELMTKLETLIKGQGPTMVLSPSTGLA